VVARVQQDVAQRVPHLFRRRQKSEMVPIGQDRPAAPRNPIHGAREPRRDRLHAAPERVAIARLDDQMRVVPLQRVVHEPEPLAGAATRERPLDLMDDGHGAQRWNVGTHAQCHVRRQRRSEVLALDMRHAGLRTFGFPARTFAATAPATGRRRQ